MLLPFLFVGWFFVSHWNYSKSFFSEIFRNSTPWDKKQSFRFWNDLPPDLDHEFFTLFNIAK